jgi:hypothetical protein
MNRGCLGALCAVMIGVPLLIGITFLTLGGTWLLWQGLALGLAFVGLAVARARSAQNRDALLGALIGLGVVALLWGLCTAAFSR